MRGWTLEGEMSPHISKCVVIAAPHTSNWDLPNMLMVALALNINICWVGKHTLFRFPFGFLMRWLGGVPLDREKSFDAVTRYAQTIVSSPSQCMLAIAPSGTRKQGVSWKTGFYYIAKKARVPIVMAYMDYKTKKSGIGNIFYPTIDDKKDIKTIQDFYKTMKGKNH
jgi:1-acyl-sn-glycerol-3-phosphate acyltransferase